MASEARPAEHTGRYKRNLQQFSILWDKRSISRFFFDIRFKVYSLLLLVLKPTSQLPIFTCKLVRRIIFDTTKPNTLLLSTGCPEALLVSASDKVIGRYTYVNREPYDFDKVQQALSILGNARPKMQLIDIGANIGTICIPAVKRGAFQKAIAIEPEPRNYSLLLANIHINGLGDKIVAHNFALGQKDDEKLLFELSNDNFGDHRVRTGSGFGLDHELNREVITVASDTFDKIIKQIDPKESLIWIDTQGFEGQVLSGARNALSVQTPVCFEFWPNGMKRSNSYRLLKEALILAGYTVFYDLNGNPFPVPITSSSFDDLYERLRNRDAFTELLVL